MMAALDLGPQLADFSAGVALGLSVVLLVLALVGGLAIVRRIMGV